jgi:hypothetical protein
METDFSAMIKAELRAYVVTHPNDVTAFQAFVDRFTSDASPEMFDLPKSTSDYPEVELLIRQKLAQKLS